MEPPKAKPWPVPREGAYAIIFRASRYPGDMIHVESAEGLAAMVDNIRHVSRKGQQHLRDDQRNPVL